MATVQRANVILQISDEPDVIQKYRDKGYNVIDSTTGEIIERAVPHDTEALQLLVNELRQQLQQKDSEIEELKKKLKKAKKQTTK